MLVITRDARQIGQFCHAVYQDGNRIAEIALNVIQRERRIFDSIMKQARGDHIGGDAQVGENACHGETMIDVWLTRMALLLTMRLLRHPVGALNQLPLGKSIIFRELFQQSFERNSGSGCFHSNNCTTCVKSPYKAKTELPCLLSIMSLAF